MINKPNTDIKNLLSITSFPLQSGFNIESYIKNLLIIAKNMADFYGLYF